MSSYELKWKRAANNKKPVIVVWETNKMEDCGQNSVGILKVI